MQSFIDVAPFYDELMKGVPYEMWVSYYLLLLSHQDIHPKTLLDVCCGTGTMCEKLANDGFQVTGIDLSAPMIEEARRKARRRKLAIQYEVGDASSFCLGRRFGGALSFFDSLNNILDPARLEAAFAQVAEHLEPGGSWIFDLNTPYAFEAKLFDQENFRSNARIRYKWVGDWDADSRIISVDMKFWRRGEAIHEVHRQRAYEEPEVREMLERTGFGQVHAFHSYTLMPPRARSDRIHYTAVRI